MKPLRSIVGLALLCGALGAVAFAAPQAETPAARSGVGALPTPAAVGLALQAQVLAIAPMAGDPELVAQTLNAAFFSPQSTPAQALAAQYALSAIGSARTLAVVQGFIARSQAPQAAKVSAQLGSIARSYQQEERLRLMFAGLDQSKLEASLDKLFENGKASGGEQIAVDARGGGEPSEEKASLWREHAGLSASNQNRQIDPHDLFGDAGDLFSRPDVSLVPSASSAKRGWGGALRRLLEKAGAAAYLSGTVSPEGIQTARSILAADAPAQALAKAPSAAAPLSRRFADIEALAQRMDDDYFNAHGFYPVGGGSRKETVALAEPVAPAVVPVLAAPAPGRARTEELAQWMQEMDQDYYNLHGYRPGEHLPHPVRDFLITYSPIVGLALFAGLLAAPHGVAILAALARIAGGVFIVLLARRLGIRSVTDIPAGRQAWLARALAIGMNLLGGLVILTTVATMAGLLPH